MSGDILDTIDHVLADYEVGPDAMRWTPEAPDAKPVFPHLDWSRTIPVRPTDRYSLTSTFRVDRSDWLMSYYAEMQVGAAVSVPVAWFPVSAA